MALAQDYTYTQRSVASKIECYHCNLKCGKVIETLTEYTISTHMSLLQS